MKPIRSMVTATFMLAALAAYSPPAHAQGYFYGQGATGYSYTGFNSTYGSYGYGGVGPSFYGQNFVTGGMYGIPGGYGPVGGFYGAAPMDYYNQVLPYGQLPYGQLPYGQLPYAQLPYGQLPYGQLPYGQLPMQQYQRPTGGGWGAVNGVSPMVPRLDAAVPQLSPRLR